MVDIAFRCLVLAIQVVRMSVPSAAPQECGLVALHLVSMLLDPSISIEDGPCASADGCTVGELVQAGQRAGMQCAVALSNYELLSDSRRPVIVLSSFASKPHYSLVLGIGKGIFWEVDLRNPPRKVKLNDIDNGTRTKPIPVIFVARTKLELKDQLQTFMVGESARAMCESAAGYAIIASSVVFSVIVIRKTRRTHRVVRI